MYVKFDEIEEKSVENFNGGKGVIYIKTCVCEGEKILLLRIPSGASVGLHTHVSNSETEYILAGTATFSIDGKADTVPAGNCHYCKKGSSHSLVNMHDDELVVFAVIPEL